MVVLDPLAGLRRQVESAALDPDLTEAERAVKLRVLRDRMVEAMATLDRYLNDAEKVRESEASVAARELLVARRNATIREALIEGGEATPEELDEVGLLSHEEIDDLLEEGLFGAASASIGRAWTPEMETLHPRGRGGRWINKLGAGLPPVKGDEARAESKLPEFGGPTRPLTSAERKLAGVRDEETAKLERQVMSDHAVHAGDRKELDRRLAELGVPTELLNEIHDLGLDGSREERRGRSELADKLLGRARDTQELYRDPVTKQYSPERRELHDKIVDEFLRREVEKPTSAPNPETGLPDEEVPTAEYHASQPAGKKRVLFMAGGNASGKSTALQMPGNEDVEPDDAVHIDFDEVKRRLPEFQEMAAAHDIYGTDATHFESADIARRILDEATKRNMNVIVDASGNSAGDGFSKTMRRMKEDGYEVDALMVDAALPLAVKSMLARAEVNGRYVPVPIMLRIHQNSVARFKEWRHAEFVDHWKLYHRGSEGHGLGDFRLAAEGGARAHAGAANAPSVPGVPRATFRDATPEEFDKAKAANARGWNLSPKTEGDFKGATVRLMEPAGASKSGGASGYMVKDGDLQNVFNNSGVKGAASAGVVNAVELDGARTLDCYGEFLPRYYSRFGFAEVARQKFDPAFAPDDMPETEKMKAPDVVFMAYQGGDPATIGERVGRFDYHPSEEYVDDFDRGKELAAQAVSEPAGGDGDVGRGGGVPGGRGAAAERRGVPAPPGGGGAGGHREPAERSGAGNVPFPGGGRVIVHDQAGYDAVLAKASRGGTLPDVGRVA